MNSSLLSYLYIPASIVTCFLHSLENGHTEGTLSFFHCNPREFKKKCQSHRLVHDILFDLPYKLNDPQGIDKLEEYQLCQDKLDIPEYPLTPQFWQFCNHHSKFGQYDKVLVTFVFRQLPCFHDLKCQVVAMFHGVWEAHLLYS